MYVSIIIPSLNERENLPETLAFVTPDEGRYEIIVVDGGSTDGTTEWVRELAGIRLVESDRGRGMQLRAGAMAATGDALVFLHADCLLPAGFIDHIAKALSDPEVAGGAFEIRFPDGTPPPLPMTARFVNFRSRFAREATGDQAIFVRRSAYERAGGFANWPLFEDMDLVTRLKRRGRFVILPTSVTISPRRWLQHGVGRTNLLMALLYAGYKLGISPTLLARLYRDVRPRKHP